MHRQGSASSSISLNSWGSEMNFCSGGAGNIGACSTDESHYDIHQLVAEVPVMMGDDSSSSFNFSSTTSSSGRLIVDDALLRNPLMIMAAEYARLPGLDAASMGDPLQQLHEQHASLNTAHVDPETSAAAVCEDHANRSPCDSFEILLSRRPPSLTHYMQEKDWSRLVLMMKERFAKLLLGEDFFGGSNAGSTALTISNSITKLSASIFGELWRLEPLSQETKLRWQREMEWLVSPCDYIVELVPSSQSMPNGTRAQVMASKPRTDVYIGLPALQKLDVMLLETLESFRDTEFWYVESVQESPSREVANDFPECKVWVPLAKVPSCGLSEDARKQLSHQREAAQQILKAAKSINEHVLSEMDIPESYLRSLPKSGKKVMGDSPLRIVTSEFCCFETLISTLECPSYKTLLELANGLESLIHVWNIKVQSRLSQHGSHKACRASATWGITKDGSVRKLERKKIYVERAQTLLAELRHRFPGLLQTSLELRKIHSNKDLGYAVLESYSRVLVNLAARIQSRIGEIISADKETTLCRMHSLRTLEELGKDAGAEGPLSTPRTPTNHSMAQKGHESYPRVSSDSSMLHLGLQLEMLLSSSKQAVNAARHGY